MLFLVLEVAEHGGFWDPGDVVLSQPSRSQGCCDSVPVGPARSKAETILPMGTCIHSAHEHKNTDKQTSADTLMPLSTPTYT